MELEPEVLSLELVTDAYVVVGVHQTVVTYDSPAGFVVVKIVIGVSAMLAVATELLEVTLSFLVSATVDALDFIEDEAEEAWVVESETHQRVSVVELPNASVVVTVVIGSCA